MPNLDRRKLLHAGIALAVPLGGMSMLGGCQQSTESAQKSDSPKVAEPENTVVKKN